jgi:hypothetical protein
VTDQDQPGVDTDTDVRAVVRTGVSPMNPRVKWAELACGHDLFVPRKPRIGAMVRCPKCLATRERPSTQEAGK